MIFRIDLKIFLILILFYFTNQIEVYTLIMIFAILHELSHLIAGLILKMKVKRIALMPIGLSIEFKLSYDDYNKKLYKSNLLDLKKLIIAISGPLFNIFVIILALFLNINNNLKNLIIYSNLLIAIFNLLPIYPLDGGRILKEIIKIFYGHKVSTIFMVKFTKFILVLLSLLYSIIILKIKNIAILFLMFYLWWLYIIEERKAVTLKRVYGIIEKSIEKNLV